MNTPTFGKAKPGTPSPSRPPKQPSPPTGPGRPGTAPDPNPQPNKARAA